MAAVMASASDILVKFAKRHFEYNGRIDFAIETVILTRYRTDARSSVSFSTYIFGTYNIHIYVNLRKIRTSDGEENAKDTRSRLHRLLFETTVINNTYIDLRNSLSLLTSMLYVKTQIKRIVNLWWRDCGFLILERDGTRNGTAETQPETWLLRKIGREKEREREGANGDYLWQMYATRSRVFSWRNQMQCNFRTQTMITRMPQITSFTVA